jgi:hypothetical protein
VARLMLNADDNNLFYNRILLRPHDRKADVAPTLEAIS